MAGPFYFAYVGGQTDAAFSLTTTGDIWGGELSIQGATWGGTLNTTADLVSGTAEIVNMVRDDGLVSGNTYTISGRGIPTLDADGNPLTVEFIYDGFLQGAMTENALASAVGSPILISSTSGRNIVNLYSIAELVSGRVYGIEGGGIPAATTFTFAGSNVITISQNCTTSNNNAALKVTSLIDKNLIKNLSNTTGLVNGQTYIVFGQGVPSGTIAIYEGGTTITISNDAVATFTGVSLNISKGVTFSDGGAFDPSVHLVEDEKIFTVELSQSEGDFAYLVIEIPKLNVGILNSSRKVWCWFAWDTGTDRGIVPIFHGRVMGMPQDTGKQTVSLRFIARPEDYAAQKIALANTLKSAPYWDEVFLAENADDPDTVLTARTQLWHVGRTDLTLTVSDIIAAEDGTIEITSDQVHYDGFNVNPLNAPLRSINVNADVTWTQSGQGTVDLTDMMFEQFSSIGSGLGYPVITTFTGDGLKTTWPAAFASLGGGWTMDASSQILDATWQQAGQYAVQYHAPDPAAQTTQVSLTTDNSSTQVLGPATVPLIGTQLMTNEATYDVLFGASVLSMNFVIAYEAARDRTETVSFTLQADVQSVMVEPGVTEVEQIDLHSDFISSPVDPDGAIPILDLRRNSYFKTTRGQQSFQYLIMLAIAHLLSKARCVEVQFDTDWLSLIDASCRKNIHITDPRIIGASVGEATGKITEYTFKGSGDNGDFIASAKIGCTVGNGNTIADIDGTGVYAADGYMDAGYQKETGGHITLIPNTITYESFDDFQIYDDDGLDLLNMTTDNVVISLQIMGGLDEQKNAIDLAAAGNSDLGDPVTALSLTPTRVRLQLKPVTGGPFNVEYSVIVSQLAVPKTIDLGG